MAYEKFPWRPRPNPTITNNPKSITASFGDGYEESSPDGLNYNRKAYQLNFRIVGSVEKQRVVDFLERHGSHASFYIYSDSRMKDVLVKCSSYNEQPNHGANYCDFSLTLKESIL